MAVVESELEIVEQAQEARKITWGEFKEYCYRAGVRDSDEIDCIDVSWGDIEELQCRKDVDFGWQITLGV